jgi:hypothetical protein
VDLHQEILSPKYRDAVRTTLKVQVPLAILSLLIFDEGQTAKVCGATMAGFWLSAAFIAWRRPWTPTTWDLRFWRWGFLPAFVAALYLAASLGRL